MFFIFKHFQNSPVENLGFIDLTHGENLSQNVHDAFSQNAFSSFP